MIAVDTNFLVHAHREDTTQHEKANARLRELAESGAQWAICFHCLVEFYGVVTRSGIWKQPSPPQRAWDQIHAWLEAPDLHLLSDDRVGLETLERLTVSAGVQGSVVHDARIAACCLSHGVRELWTVDRDFSRFPELRTRNPLIGSK